MQLEHEERTGIGPYREKCSVAQSDLPAVADQQLDPHRRKNRIPDDIGNRYEIETYEPGYEEKNGEE